MFDRIFGRNKKDEVSRDAKLLEDDFKSGNPEVVEAARKSLERMKKEEAAEPEVREYLEQNKPAYMLVSKNRYKWVEGRVTEVNLADNPLDTYVTIEYKVAGSDDVEIVRSGLSDFLKKQEEYKTEKTQEENRKLDNEKLYARAAKDGIRIAEIKENLNNLEKQSPIGVDSLSHNQVADLRNRVKEDTNLSGLYDQAKIAVAQKYGPSNVTQSKALNHIIEVLAKEGDSTERSLAQKVIRLKREIAGETRYDTPLDEGEFANISLATLKVIKDRLQDEQKEIFKVYEKVRDELYKKSEGSGVSRGRVLDGVYKELQQNPNSKDKIDILIKIRDEETDR